MFLSTRSTAFSSVSNAKCQRFVSADLIDIDPQKELPANIWPTAWVPGQHGPETPRALSDSCLLSSALPCSSPVLLLQLTLGCTQSPGWSHTTHKPQLACLPVLTLPGEHVQKALVRRLPASCQGSWTSPRSSRLASTTGRRGLSTHGQPCSDFATKWVQRMSFTVVRFHVMPVLAGC